MEESIQGLTNKIIIVAVAALVGYIVVSLAIHKGLATAIPNKETRNSLVSLVGFIVLAGIFYGVFKTL